MVDEHPLFVKWKTSMEVGLLYFVVVFLLLSPLASSLSDEGKSLMSMKASFSNVANVLQDWDDVHNDDFCSWRGVSCGNISISVVALNFAWMESVKSELGWRNLTSYWRFEES